MTRLIMAAVLMTGLFWVSAPTALAQNTEPSPQTQKINELIAKGWKEGGVTKPAARSTDDEFLRRAFIDLIGRIPTPEEVLDFEGDRSANKRAKLIGRLLYDTKYTPRDRTGKPVKSIAGLKKVPIDYNDAYAENFAELWTTWMLTRSNTNDLYRTQFHTWLADKFAKETPWDKIVQEVISATGRTNENGAVVFVLRHLGEPIVDADARRQGIRENTEKDGKYDAVPITSRVTRLFLGIKTQCVQCHDHPFHKEYVQADFWGVNAFFRQTDRSGTTNPQRIQNGITPPQLTLKDSPGWNGPGMVLYERRDGQRRASYPAMLKDLAEAEIGEMSKKKLVSGNIPGNLQGKSRRQILADWVVEHDNFAKAFVNRMWGHLFGRGLNAEPAVDDFSMDNKVVHPELLDYLAAEFKKYNYDPKKLLDWICNSDVYQLSHVVHKDGKEFADPKYDPYFARMPLKAMSPEVLFDSLSVATRAETRKNREEYERLKNTWRQRLTQNFGDDEGNEINFNGTVVQALLMMNGRELNMELGSGKGRDGVIPAVMQKRGINPAGIYDELFLMTVSRHPTGPEIRKLEAVRTGGAGINVGSTPPQKGKRPAPGTGSGFVPVAGASPDDVSFYRDVFWALLNSGEFMLNH